MPCGIVLKVRGAACGVVLEVQVGEVVRLCTSRRAPSSGSPRRRVHKTY
jgi:hypothetical protein